MPSKLETVLERQRADLLKADAVALMHLIDAYQASRDRLKRQLAEMGPLAFEDPRRFRQDRLRSLMRQVEAELTLLGTGAAKQTIARQGKLVEQAGKDAKALVSAQAPTLGVSFHTLPKRSVEELVGSMGDGSPVRSVLAKHFGDATERAERALAAGVATGQGPRDLARSLAKVTDDLMVKHVLVLARTEPMRAYRTASLQSYALNDDVVEQWQWIATLSARTCLACLGQHGRKYGLQQSFFMAHPACRCSPIPVVAGFDLDIGPTGNDWFDAQEPEVQAQIMGKAAHAAYERGEVAFHHFTGMRMHPVWGPSVKTRTLTQALGMARSGPTPTSQRVPKATPAPPPPPPPPPVTIPREYPAEGYATPGKAKDWAKQHFPHVTWEFEGAHIDALNPSLAAFSELAAEYPEVAERLRYVGTYQGPAGSTWGTFKGQENAYAHASVDGKRIGLNPVYYGDPKTFAAGKARGKAVGWSVGGTIETTMIHEFGHQINNWLLSAGTAAVQPYVAQSGRGLVSTTTRDWQDWMGLATTAVSEYAGTNQAETWAEGFTFIKTRPKKDWPTLVKRQKRLLDTIGDTSKWRTDWLFASDLSADARRDALAALEDWWKKLVK